MALNQFRRWLRGNFRAEKSGLRRTHLRRIRPGVEELEIRLAPANGLYTVTSAADDGSGKQGTLSWAIQQAVAWDQPNNPANPKQLPGTINFNVGGGTITVTGGEPAITKPMTINGYSQGGSNTMPGRPYIELKGGPGNGLEALSVSSGGVLIEALAIDSFGTNGIDLNDPGVSAGQGDSIQACYIGTNTTGTAVGLGNAFGISIEGSNNTIGGSNVNYGNIISGNTTDGISLGGPGAVGNVINCNLIGLDNAGDKLANTRFGISLVTGAASNTIGGELLGNVISGNGSDGINISPSNQNGIYGNIIGMNGSGTVAEGNGGNGIAVDGATSGNFIGGRPGSGTGNLISGNTKDGIFYFSPGAENNDTIIGNSIGVNLAGTAAAPNGQNGIEISESVGLSIDDNVISGNTQNGLQIAGDIASKIVVTMETSVDSNTIGLTANGAAALGNGADGIYIAFSNQNTIGGEASGDINIISANVIGVEISNSNSNSVLNNYVGTDVTGKIAIGNTNDGVFLHNGSENNTIGSASSANMNLISGNLWNGIELNTANSNVIAGNSIGTDVTGLAKLGNVDSGVYLSGNASDNTIGAQGSAFSNLISGNGNVGPNDAGIDIRGASCQNNLIEGNYIGTNKTGNAAIPNAGDGIILQAAGGGNSIGVANVNNSGNLISGNGGYGIDAVNTTLASVCFNTVGYAINGNLLKNSSGWFDGPVPLVENNNKTQ